MFNFAMDLVLLITVWTRKIIGVGDTEEKKSALGGGELCPTRQISEREIIIYFAFYTFIVFSMGNLIGFEGINFKKVCLGSQPCFVFV